MKRLYAILTVILLAVIPITAEAAYNTQLWANVSNPYPEGRHHKVMMDSMASITLGDSQASVTSDVDGYFDINGYQQYAGAGIIQFATGPAVYFYVSGPSSNFHPYTGCTPNWGGQGCILYIGNLTASTDDPFQIELDWYPDSGGFWVAWAEDIENTNSYWEIGTYYTSSDWFTQEKLRLTSNYVQTSNPWYVIDAEFLHPMGWHSGPAPWVDVLVSTVNTSYSNWMDAGFCPSKQGWVRFIIPNVYIVGSTRYEPSSNVICYGAF